MWSRVEQIAAEKGIALQWDASSDDEADQLEPTDSLSRVSPLHQPVNDWVLLAGCVYSVHHLDTVQCINVMSCPDDVHGPPQAAMCRIRFNEAA